MSVGKQLFWGGMGASALGLILILVTVLLPRNRRLNEIRGKVGTGVESFSEAVEDQEIPGRPDIGSWEHRRRELEEALNGSVRLIESGDVGFEGWFEELGVAPDGTPNGGDFLTWHGRKQEEIDRALGWADEPDPKGWLQPGIEWLNKRKDPLGAMKDLQKMFWIRRRFAGCLEPMLAVERGWPEAKRRVRVRHLSWRHDIYRRHGPPKRWQRPAQHPFPFDPGIARYRLPEGLGRCYILRAEFDVMLRDLPSFLSAFLTLKAHDPPMHVEPTLLMFKSIEAAPLARKVSVRVGDTDEKRMADIEAARRALKPGPIRVWMMARILDPDMEMIRKFRDRAFATSPN
jgi:hypothetical protein